MRRIRRNFVPPFADREAQKLYDLYKFPQLSTNMFRNYRQLVHLQFVDTILDSLNEKVTLETV